MHVQEVENSIIGYHKEVFSAESQKGINSNILTQSYYPSGSIQTSQWPICLEGRRTMTHYLHTYIVLMPSGSLSLSPTVYPITNDSYHVSISCPAHHNLQERHWDNSRDYLQDLDNTPHPKSAFPKHTATSTSSEVTQSDTFDYTDTSIL